jgi:3-deoxy-D-manno-octulosonic-acid transferase
MTQSQRPVSPGIVYRLVSALLLIFWVLHGLRHGAKHALPGYLSMRLGRAKEREAPQRVWIHASSVGEVQAVTPLVQALLDRGEHILFTSFTATGYRTIERNFAERLARGLIPFDFIFFCDRFFRHQRLRLGIIMETELWPELLYQARRHGLPLIQVNARLSSKTTGANAYVRRLAGATLGYFEQILARSEADRDALLGLGANPERVRVVGNLKTVTVDDQPKPRLVERDYLLLASSHAGEERAFLESRPPELADWLVVIAPRHPGRSAALQAEIAALGLSFAVRSQDQPIGAETQVYLADTLGEMKALMAHARVVVMGGSFDDTGGHNLLEPASLGCAIITGPSDSSIRQDIAMLGEGLLQVGDVTQCWRHIGELLADPDQARQLGERARERIARQPNMVEKYLGEIAPWL